MPSRQFQASDQYPPQPNPNSFNAISTMKTHVTPFDSTRRISL